MKYYIHSLDKNTYYAVDSFDKMIDYFVRQNRSNSSYGFYNREEVTIDPRKHSYRDYNRALNNIAMHPNEYCTRMGYDFYDHRMTGMIQISEHYLLVKDELGRTIDPRNYWDIIATRQPLPSTYRSRWRRTSHLWEFRHDPVPGVGGHRGGRSYTNVRTFQERKLSCDPEIKEFINPSRSLMTLPTSWDGRHRDRDHSWKAKKIEKQWMKRIAK